MAKKYVARCSIRKDKRSYPKGTVFDVGGPLTEKETKEGKTVRLTEQEAKRGVAQKWLEEIGHEDVFAGEKPDKKTEPAK